MEISQSTFNLCLVLVASGILLVGSLIGILKIWFSLSADQPSISKAGIFFCTASVGVVSLLMVFKDKLWNIVREFLSTATSSSLSMIMGSIFFSLAVGGIVYLIITFLQDRRKKNERND